jgi:hypothetical protein
MRAVPRLRVELRPSRLARCVIASASVATSVLLLALPLPPAVLAITLALIGLWTIREIERCAGRGVPALLHVGVDHRLTVTDARGRSRDGSVLPGTFVTASAICLRWRPDGASRWARLGGGRTLLLVADMAAPDVLRELRVRLRYGAGERRANSGVPSRRPSAQSAAANSRPLEHFD